jgi:hypothetical protein
MALSPPSNCRHYQYHHHGYNLVQSSGSDLSLSCTFSESGFELEVRDYEPGLLHRLAIGGLFAAVVPGRSRVKLATNKAIVTLHKENEAVEWRQLQKALVPAGI